MPLFTLTGESNISLIFMRLPDGNIDGSGFASTDNVSLQDLWTGTISSIDGGRRFVQLHEVLADQHAHQPDDLFQPGHLNPGLRWNIRGR